MPPIRGLRFTQQHLVNKLMRTACLETRLPRFIILLTALLGLTGFAAVAGAASTIAERAALFFGRPILQSVSLSPEGTHLAYLAEHEGNRSLFVYDIKAEKGIAYVGRGATDVDTYKWIGPRHIWGTHSEKDIYFAGNFTVELGRSGVRDWPATSPGSRQVDLPGVDLRFVDDLAYVPEEVILRGAKNNVYYRVNPVSGKIDRILEVRNHLQWAYFSPTSGEPHIRISDDQAGTVVLEYLDEAGDWKTIEIGSGTISSVQLINDQVAVIGAHDGEETMGLGFVNLATGEISKPLMRRGTQDLVPLKTIYASGKIAGILYNGGQIDDVLWLDPEYRHLAQSLKSALPDTCIIIHGRLSESSDLLIETYSDTKPLTLHRLNLETGQLTLFLSPSAHLADHPIASREPVTLPARDGTTLYGYLLRPQGEAEPKPLVISLIGGPGSRISSSFNLESQYLTSLGYSVLELAYRGCQGYGRSYEGSMLDLRHAIQFIGTDAADAARWAVEAGHALPGQIAVFGASFGGFGAYSAAAEDPEAFRCVIAALGVFDWEGQAKTDMRRFKSGYREALNTQVQSDPEFFARHNLIKRASDVKAPTLLLAGGADRRVDTAQSRQLHRERSKARLPSELKVLSWAGHGFYRDKEAIEYYRLVGAFLDQHLAPAKPVKY